MAGFIKELTKQDGNFICYNLDTSSSFIDSILDDYKCLPYVSFYYAIKANGNEKYLKLMSSKGVGADCASIEEINLAKRNKFNEISVTCPGFDGKEVRNIIEQNIHFDVDNWGQLNDANLYDVNIGLRVDTEINESRFGFKIEELPSEDYLKDHRINIDTLHIHYGNKDEESLISLINYVEKLLSTNKIFKNIRKLNIGGGIELFYISGKKEILKNGIIKLHDVIQSSLDYPVQIIMEPGTLFSIPVGYLNAKVKYVNKNKIYLGFSNFNLGEWNKLNILAVNGQLINVNNEAKYTYELYGNTCLEGDMFGKFSMPFEVKKGDDIILFPVGAYNYSLVRNLHSMPNPKIIYYENGEIIYD